MKFRINQMAAAIAMLGASSMVPATAADGVAAAGSEQPTQLEPVVVKDTRLQPVPAASPVGEETLRALRPATSDTASLLRDVPGVELQGAGGVSSLPVIRGLADDRNRIIVDGMDLIASCPNYMNPPLSYLDPNGVSKLRVIAGVTPVSLGGDSIGGTIIAESLAHDADDRIIYNRTTGAVSYDADGNGAGAAVVFAVINNKVALTNADFFVV